MPRADRLRTSLALALALVGLLAAARAAAQQVPVANFAPAIATNNYYVTEGGRTLPHLVPSVALLFHYARRPLDLRDRLTDTLVAEVVRYQADLEVTAALGLWDHLELGVALPITLAQGGDLAAIGRGDSLGAGLGDLRLQPKVRFGSVGPLSFGLALPVTLPTAAKDSFLGNAGATFAPRAIFALDLPWFSAAANLGVRVRKDQSVQVVGSTQTLAVGNDLIASLGVKVPLWRERIELLGDAFVSMSLVEQKREEVPVELLLGARFRLPRGFVLNAAAGPGLTRGVGTPVYRLLAGLGWHHVPPSPREGDRDRDGISDVKDRCPDAPEDRDGFEDADGCPDPDNDLDGISDGKDQCPDEAEDYDGDRDDDGCPDGN